jgi:hypothetical protein
MAWTPSPKLCLPWVACRPPVSSEGELCAQSKVINRWLNYLPRILCCRHNHSDGLSQRGVLPGAQV